MRNQDGGVVLDVEQGKVFHLNRTGALIWDRLQEHCPPEQIISEICSSFAIPETSATADVKEFLAGLENEGLLRRVHGKEVPCA